MTPKQYRKAIDELGWSQVEAARQLGIGPRSSRRYALGERKIPKSVELLLKRLVDEENEKKRLIVVGLLNDEL